MQPIERFYGPCWPSELALSAACTKDAADTTDADGNTAPTAQEELCADYPDNIACPTLPAPPQLRHRFLGGNQASARQARCGLW